MFFFVRNSRLEKFLEKYVRFAMILSALLFLAVFLNSCAYSSLYERTKTGKFSKMDFKLAWISPKEFMFIQDPKAPFTFTDSQGKKIVPGVFPTDGGSIPRSLWSFSGYSPWELGPAYVIHDWIFTARQLGHPDFDDMSFEDSVRIFNESVKTLMLENEEIDESKTRLYNMNLGVKSVFARSRWNKRMRSVSLPPSYLILFRETEKLLRLGFDTVSAGFGALNTVGTEKND